MSKCTECKYESLSECEYPCNICRRSAEQGFLNSLGKIDHFEPKEVIEHDGCDGCFYSFLSAYEVPCCECIYNIYNPDTNYLKAKNYFKPKEKEHSSNCMISVKECNKAFKNEDYGFENVDMVNHSQHYQHGIEPIDYIESHNLNFNLGNVIQYVSRAPFEGTELQDLKEAKWYLEREIDKYVD